MRFGPMTLCRTPLPARSVRNICGSPAPICAPGFSTIMHNQNVNEVRRAMRDDTTVDVKNCASVLIAATDPTASRQLSELERALGELPEEQRQVILLVGLEGMSYEDAAAVLTVPIGTIRSRLSRGRDALRKLMGMEINAGSAAPVRNLAPEHLADTPAAPMAA